jgi:CRP-like cAMP-binding protein
LSIVQRSATSLILFCLGGDARADRGSCLAEMIGTTRSRVSFFMNKFRELGLIDYNGGIEVHSSLLNVVLHDQPQIKT